MAGHGNRNKTPHPKDDRDTKNASEPMKPMPFCQQILKRKHAPHEQFNAKSFPFDELIPNWKGDSFDVHFMNAATRRTFKNKHHVKGIGAKKRSDFEHFEFAFCLEWINRTIDGVTVRDRCYNQFTVKSNGCMDHPKTEYKDGPNRIYYELIRGETCTWDMLRDVQAAVTDDCRKHWGYAEYRAEAEALTAHEYALGIEESRKDLIGLIERCLAESEAW